MISEPLVTIIIPCYNYGRFLADALNSVYNQTYKNWECLIVDDGSIDNTYNVSKFYIDLDRRFKYFHQENRGHSAARNTAISYAQGSYIQFLDADDKLENRKLELHIEFLKANKNVDVVYSDIILFNDDKINIGPPSPIFSKPRVSGKDDIIVNNLMDDNFFLPGCSMFKSDLLKVSGGFKPSYGFEDWEFWYRVALLGFSFSYFSPSGTALLVRSHSNNTSKNFKSMMASKIEVRQEILSFTRSLKNKNLHKVSSFLNLVIAKQKVLLGLDKAFYNLRYSNGIAGLLGILYFSIQSKDPFTKIFEGAHLVKARLISKKF